MVERITDDMPEEMTRGHRFRYHLAAGFLFPGYTVVDAAAGIGYGRQILMARSWDVSYVGVDRNPGIGLLRADLETWVPDFDFEVFVGFETLEHLDNYETYLQVASMAKEWAIMSVPIVPTRHTNPWHKHDFQSGDLADLFLAHASDRWYVFDCLRQPSEYSEIVIFRRAA